MGTGYGIEKREKMLRLKEEGKGKREISEAVGLSVQQVTWFFGNYNRNERLKAENRPKLKRGRRRKPEPTRWELEKIIKAQKKLLKLYEDFLQLSGRM